jgi:hypothetical protein
VGIHHLIKANRLRGEVTSGWRLQSVLQACRSGAADRLVWQRSAEFDRPTRGNSVARAEMANSWISAGECR